MLTTKTDQELRDIDAAISSQLADILLAGDETQDATVAELLDQLRPVREEMQRRDAELEAWMDAVRRGEIEPEL